MIFMIVRASPHIANIGKMVEISRTMYRFETLLYEEPQTLVCYWGIGLLHITLH